eukprot:14164830-Ditylum_brightwellii.AAC.1
MAMMSKFRQNIKLYNSWLMGQRSVIVKEVGVAGYTEYLHCHVKRYMMSINANFRASIKDQRKKWMIGDFKAG